MLRYCLLTALDEWSCVFAEQRIFLRNRCFGQRCALCLKLCSLSLEMKIPFISEVVAS